MQYVSFEESKNYNICDLCVVCNYKLEPADETTDQHSIERVNGKEYYDPHYLEDLFEYYEAEENQGKTWWEAPFYFNAKRVVLLSTVDFSKWVLNDSRTLLFLR